MSTGFKIIKREEWLKSGITGRINKVLNHPFSVIHHTATPAEEYKGEINYLDRFHRQRGFLLIGYHFIIAPDGKIFEGREIGEEGAHTKRYNFSIGISLIGNFEIEEIKEKQITSLLNLFEFLYKRFHIKKFSFHFLFNKNTVCGKKIFEKIIRNKDKKFFTYPDDLSYNIFSGSNPEFNY